MTRLLPAPLLSLSLWALWLLLNLSLSAGNLLLGYGVQSAKSARSLIMVLPLTVALSLYLIADIDSPRGGWVRVSAENLSSFALSVRTP